MEFGFYDTIPHLENAEMTTELCDDLINFSFDNLHNTFKNYPIHNPTSRLTLHHFVPPFLECLKKLVCYHFHSCILVFMHFMIQPLSEADHICQTLQFHFDRMLVIALERNHSFPGFTLLLGGIFQYVSAKQPFSLVFGIEASSYLIWRRGEGHIIDNLGFFGPSGIISRSNALYFTLGTSGFLHYLAKFLGSPGRSGLSFFGQESYAMAAKECLQLYLCSHRNFSKGATEFSCRDKVLRRSKPWEWLARMGVHSRIRKHRHHLKVHQHKFHRYIIYEDLSFPKISPKHQYSRFLSYRWALGLLPCFLERSTISLELANVLRGCTFTTMAWRFPRRMRLTEDAIAKYLLRVESVVGNP